MCIHNAARSQMAEGLFRDLYGDIFDVYSAGSEPQAVDPLAITCMEDLGIDISHHRSKSLKEFEGQEFDYVVTVCGNPYNACPFFVGGKKNTSNNHLKIHQFLKAQKKKNLNYF